MTTKEDWAFRAQHFSDFAKRLEDRAAELLKQADEARQRAAKINVDFLEAATAAQALEIARLRGCIEDIKRATLAGRVCDDVAWFDGITTLHDFCEMVLDGDSQGAAKEIVR